MPPLPRTAPTVAIAAFVGLSALVVRHRLSYLGLSPRSYALPDLPHFVPDNRLAGVGIDVIGARDLVYPECLVLTNDRRYMFASLGDGRVVRLVDIDMPTTPRWTTIVGTGPTFDGDVEGGKEDGAERCGAGGPSDDHPTYGPGEERCGRPLGMWLVEGGGGGSVPSDGGGGEGSELGGEDEGNGRKNDVLYIADAYRGLVAVTNLYGPGLSNARVLASNDGTSTSDRFALLNSVILVPESGDLYVTETSTRFRRRRIFHAAMDGASDGRLLRYSASTGKIDVVADGIYMANGLALAHDRRGLLIVSGVRVLRYDLTRGDIDEVPFVNVMPGTGDNIKAMDVLPNGTSCRCYWAGLGGKYARPFSLLWYLSDRPWLRSILLALMPYRKLIDLIPKWTALAVYDEEGTLITTLTDDGSFVGEDGIATMKGGVMAPWISEAEPVGNYIYLASWYNPFLARIDKRDIVFE
jgi:hypothetical protein